MAQKLYLGEAARLVWQTKAYLIYRASIYGIVAGVMAVGLLVLALIGMVFGHSAAIVLFMIAVVGCGWAMRFLREYVLYMLQAGQLALVTELATQGKLPEGAGQTEWAKERVKHYYKEMSVLAMVDQLVKGIVGAVNNTLFNVLTILPIPGLDGLAKVAQKIVDYSLTYVDEAIISHTFRTRNENVFEAASQGVVLYCHAWKGMLKNAVALTLLGYAFTVAATVLFLIPLGVVAMMAPHSWELFRFFMFGLAVVLGTVAKWIVFDPLACTAAVLTFLRETEGVEPDKAWEEKIAGVSDKFRELKEKAAAKMREMGKPAAGEAVPSAAAAGGAAGGADGQG